MKKFGFLVAGLMMITVLSFYFSSCTKNIKEPVNHEITYLLTNHSTEPMEFYIAYTDPAYANMVHVNYDTITTWQHSMTAQSAYPCQLEVYTKEDNADFSISILQDTIVKMDTVATLLKEGKTYAELKFFVE